MIGVVPILSYRVARRGDRRFGDATVSVGSVSYGACVRRGIGAISEATMPVFWFRNVLRHRRHFLFLFPLGSTSITQLFYCADN